MADLAPHYQNLRVAEERLGGFLEEEDDEGECDVVIEEDDNFECGVCVAGEEGEEEDPSWIREELMMDIGAGSSFLRAVRAHQT